MKKIFLVLALFFAFPLLTRATAASCTSEVRSNLQKIANSVEIAYEFNDVNKKYDVIINGLDYRLYIFNPSIKLYQLYLGESVITLPNYLPGQTYDFPFYGSVNSACPQEYLFTKTIYLAPYNQYYNDPLCKGNEEYELCKKFSSINVDSYDQFKQLVNDYIAEKNKPTPEPEKKPPVVKENFWNKVVNFLLEYNLYFLLPIIIFGIVGIVIIEVRRRSNILYK